MVEQTPVFATEAAIAAIDDFIIKAKGREAAARLFAGQVASHDDVDLHENVQYHMLIAALGPLENDVEDLFAMRLRLKPGEGQGNFGKKMTIRIENKFDEPTDEKIILVGPAELKILGAKDPETGRTRVSYESPIGKALLNGELSAGKSQDLELPGGRVKITVKELE